MSAPPWTLIPHLSYVQHSCGVSMISMYKRSVGTCRQRSTTEHIPSCGHRKISFVAFLHPLSLHAIL